ncbi:Protein BAT5, partial [Operophtera brumata]
ALYQPHKIEEYADIVISVLASYILQTNVFYSVSYYMSPFIGMYMYRRGFFTVQESETLVKLFTGIGCFLFMAFLIRAYGRVRNPQYMMFLDALNSPKEDLQAYLSRVRRFDFEFYAWPATYEIPYNPDNPCWNRSQPFVSKENNHLPFYQKCIVKSLAYIAVHTFALRLIYPGSLGLIQLMLWNPLVHGRASFIEDSDGQRVKVITADGNSIDTMFVDCRNRPHPNGKILVICSEGNSGFYEIGIMNTPLKAGYSVLGWNHPGFAGSTGLPYPRQEHCAIDAVMQYAILVLKFQPEQIVMFGWSIGGYSAAWAAGNYHTKALILDATFDDLVPLAVNQMPASWEPLVKEVVRGHVDLNYSSSVLYTFHCNVPCARSPGDISSNRGNHLLLKVISHRHASEVDQLLELLIRFTMVPEARRLNPADPLLDTSVRNVLLL